MVLKIYKRSTNFNNEAISLFGVVTLFYAGTYSIKVILSGIGLSSLEGIGALFFYLVWAYALLRLLMNNYFLVPKILLFEALFGLVLLMNQYFFPYTKEYYTEYFMFLRQIFFAFLPCGVVFSQIYDYDNAFLYIRKYAYIGLIIMMISFPLGYVNRWGEQYWGVQLSPMILILFQNYLQYRKKSDAIFSFIGLFMLLIGGRQSFVIAVLTMATLYTYFNRKKSVKTLVIIFSGIVIGMVIISGLYTTIAKGILSIFQNMGIETRALASIASGDLLNVATRMNIYRTAWANITQNGSIISGLFADRYYLRQVWPWMTYSHNIVLEFLLDFGTVLGSIVFILLLFLIAKNLKNRSDTRTSFAIIIILIVMIRLMVSSSFIIEGYFFVMIGFLLGKWCVKYKKQ